MKLLPDTHLLVWTAQAPDRLPAEAVELIEDPGNELFFSSVSIWEVSIKQALRRADFTVDAGVLRRRLLENGFREIAVTGEHSIALLHLAPIHRDPFDRMLIAQATVEDITLLTADRVIAQYRGPIRKV
jgi:PIN domain nuclease of toxin-antitoxin system